MLGDGAHTRSGTLNRFVGVNFDYRWEMTKSGKRALVEGKSGGETTLFFTQRVHGEEQY